MDLGCFVPFLALAGLLWTGAWLLARKARGNRDAAFQRRLSNLLDGEPAPEVGRRASPWLWVFAVVLALLAFGVTLCTGAVMLDSRNMFR